MPHKLTQRFVSSLTTPEPGGQRFADSDLRGFAVQVYPSGRKVFQVRYRNTLGRRRLMVVGDYGPLTVETAREQARALLGSVALGSDPAEAAEARQSAPEWAEWVKVYLEGVQRRKKSWKEDYRYLNSTLEKDLRIKLEGVKELEPEGVASWGTKKLADLTAEDVTKAFERTDKDAGRTSANRFLASVRACLQAAWRLDKVAVNVAMKVRALPENPPRQRVLDDDELGRALEAVASLPDPYARLAFILLIETGARLSEVLHARWVDIDLEGKLWRLPSPKSGKPQVIPLPDSTCAAVRNVKRLGPYVIPGQSGNAPRSDLKGPWNLIRENAELSDCNIHDLRRSFGLRVARAAGLHVASKLLRHSTVRVTETVYAPLGIDELRKASNKAARVVGKVLIMHRKKKTAHRGVLETPRDERDIKNRV